MGKIEITVHYSGHQKVQVDPEQVVKNYRNNLGLPSVFKNSGSAMDAALAEAAEMAFNEELHSIDPDFDRVDDDRLTSAIDAILGPDNG